MNLFPYKWPILLMAIPAFASAAGNWITLKNDSPPDSQELEADNEYCKNKAVIKVASTRTVNDQISSTGRHDYDETLIRLGRQLREQIQAVEDAQRVIDEKENARISNPLGWLRSQLTLEEDYRKYNQAVNAANLTAQSIDALTKAAQAIQGTRSGLGVGQKNIALASPGGRYENWSEGGQDANADSRYRHYHACMTALGYKQVLVQDPSRPYLWREK